MAASAPTLVGIDLRKAQRFPLQRDRWYALSRPFVDCLGDYLDVTMHWSDGRDQRGYAKYAGSGTSRDCFVLEGYAFKLTKAEKARSVSYTHLTLPTILLV